MNAPSPHAAPAADAAAPPPHAPPPDAEEATETDAEATNEAVMLSSLVLLEEAANQSALAGAELFTLDLRGETATLTATGADGTPQVVTLPGAEVARRAAAMTGGNAEPEPAAPMPPAHAPPPPAPGAPK